MKNENTIKAAQIRYDIRLLRIFSMLIILLCHVIKYYTFIPGHGFLGQVFNVGVETFLLISGYLYGSRKLCGFAKWYKNRTLKVWLPAVIVIVIDVAILSIVYKKNYSFTTYVAYLLNLHGLLHLQPEFFGRYLTKIDNLGPLWFTTIIMPCYLLVFPLQALNSRLDNCRKRKIRITFLICLGLLIISLGVQFTTGLISVFFVMFIFGYQFSIFEDTVIHSRKNALIVYCVCFVFQLLRLVLMRIADNTSIYSTYTSLSHFALAVGILVFFLRIGYIFPSITRRIGSMNAIMYIDEYSYFIYLTHGLFCMGETNLYNSNNNLVSSILFILCTIIASFLLKTSVEYLTKGPKALKGK